MSCQLLPECQPAGQRGLSGPRRVGDHRAAAPGRDRHRPAPRRTRPEAAADQLARRALVGAEDGRDVVETYTYAGVGGRVSRRQTTVDGRTINLDLTWTDLGRLNQLTHPDDTGIADPSRTVSHSYLLGLLSGITGYASSITYHPNLMVEELARSDHLGTIRRITNTATPPAIVAAHDYYPFGSEATSPSQDGERMKWAGYERDQQGTPTVQTDDLDYLHARYQAFNLGRFLSLDPVRGDRTRPQSFNLFAYVSNNPINRTDPLGLLEATTTPQASGGLTTMVGDGLCASQDDASDPDCEAYQRKVREEWERLVAAQDRARELFVPDDDGTTHCNQATCWIAAETGNPTGPLTNSRGNPAPANEQAAMLALSGEYREISAGEAQAQANAGVLVIAAYRNTDPSRSGHTATVRPSGVFGDMPPTGGRGPLINDVGRVVLVQHMNWVFKKDADVRFYVPVGR